MPGAGGLRPGWRAACRPPCPPPGPALLPSPVVVDCSDPNNSKYYLIIVQVRHALLSHALLGGAVCCYHSNRNRRGLHARLCLGAPRDPTQQTS